VLRAFPASRAAAFFDAIGVPLHEEQDGKLFPDTNRARTVLDALVREVARAGAVLRTGQRVEDVQRVDRVFLVRTREGPTYSARAVVLATGGRSLPKTGSDGVGYELAQRLGHSLVDTTPALVPLLLDGSRHTALAGITLPAAITIRAEGAPPVRLAGSLLWTHFGVSGPAGLDASRHWHRATLEGRHPEVRLSVLPERSEVEVDAWLREQVSARPRARLATVLSMRLPAALADAWVTETGIDPETTLAHLTREARRRVTRRLVDAPLDVRGSRGYNFAEVTAGGVPLTEVDMATMASRVCEGLYLVGEILDVDGRLGGFNFQWAWSSAWVAGQAAARALAPGRPQ
jgi:predicted Rossmann fold flavoprotein